MNFRMWKVFHSKRWKHLEDPEVRAVPEVLLVRRPQWPGRTGRSRPARRADLCRRIGRPGFQCCGSCEITMSPAVASGVRSDDLAKFVDSSPFPRCRVVTWIDQVENAAYP